MHITIKLFASLAETEGWREKAHEVAAGTTVAQVWTQATGKPLLPPRVLCAVNMNYCEVTATLESGDELAFFPPVTGG
jgi:molybdopterin synthase sulfur carrier subunit